MKLKVVCLLVLGLFAINDGKKLHLGSCQSHNPMHPFDVSKFLGEWYAVEQTTAKDPCLKYALSFKQQGILTVYETAYSLPGVPKFVNFKELHFLPSSPSEMQLRSDKMFDRRASFTILMTDYFRYAVVYICQNYWAANRESIEIWARDTHLSPTEIQTIHETLVGRGFDLSNVKVVEQVSCRASSYK